MTRTIEIASIKVTGGQLDDGQYQRLMERLHEAADMFCDDLAAEEAAEQRERIMEEVAEFRAHSVRNQPTRPS